ncbi:hypothetical protein LshimejAT787_1103520 [Lyophyllum shimeji]|uniref:Uncharacterized protein n=1 Tax=Lyophyllum shimeji TaxID=47721 RepID=A0A9P3PT52_LYOSH|nr:hypothetical protein LshimejAT787_1103520 [Lyophyllum shimeji]
MVSSSMLIAFEGYVVSVSTYSSHPRGGSTDNKLSLYLAARPVSSSILAIVARYRSEYFHQPIRASLFPPHVENQVKSACQGCQFVIIFMITLRESLFTLRPQDPRCRATGPMHHTHLCYSTGVASSPHRGPAHSPQLQPMAMVCGGVGTRRRNELLPPIEATSEDHRRKPFNAVGVQHGKLPSQLDSSLRGVRGSPQLSFRTSLHRSTPPVSQGTDINLPQHSVPRRAEAGDAHDRLLTFESDGGARCSDRLTQQGR